MPRVTDEGQLDCGPTDFFGANTNHGTPVAPSENPHGPTLLVLPAPFFSSQPRRDALDDYPSCDAVICVCALFCFLFQADKAPAVTIRTRKYMTNRLLSRKQMVRRRFACAFLLRVSGAC